VVEERLLQARDVFTKAATLKALQFTHGTEQSPVESCFIAENFVQGLGGRQNSGFLAGLFFDGFTFG
jgi:hypothetical protein